MGREVRRVPATWEHPKDWQGRYVPMHDHSLYDEEEIAEAIADGIEVMPDWPETERTHWQMYETCSEGTPISPVMETPEALARWLADNEASAFAYMTATYDQWLSMIRRGRAISMVVAGGQRLSGVEFQASAEESEHDNDLE